MDDGSTKSVSYWRSSAGQGRWMLNCGESPVGQSEVRARHFTSQKLAHVKLDLQMTLVMLMRSADKRGMYKVERTEDPR
ncbi:hypothetical protein PENARI_c008G03908 [Penicillium arizonense]|uniref:Uncharacterized protein n=1 Tax=Penicillium arizonense TaxID=1835702 RepID=A0A1F5LK05_PENAI|nr:hypothetical protein PENARI_c008G03908 [Penicillium arizonense]OGE53271.1 hypothetical protein PENARI_c008G03908 [Penicillium arizonense]